MNAKELEVVADLDDSQMSEQFSMTTESSILLNQNGRNQGAQELQKKLKKLRSTKRRAKYRSNHLVSSDAAAGSPQSISNEMSTCSDTSTDNLQNSARTLIRRSSFKPVKNLTRMSSLKFKNPLMRKSSGGTQLNNNLKKSRMAKPANSDNSRPSARKKKSGYDADSSSPSFSKETCCSNEKKTQFQASSSNSESSYCSTSETRKISVYSKPHSASPDPKSERLLTITSSPKPLKVSTKFARTKSMKCSMRKHSETSQLQELSVQRATCSSALKGSKVPDLLDLPAEGSESEGSSVMKVCPFTYCSLHGHRHANVPPLKRLISIRRRMLKNQRNKTLVTQPPLRVKRSGKIKEDKTNQMVCNGDDAVHETTSHVVEKLDREMFQENYAGPEAKPSGIGTCSEECEGNYDFEESLQQISDFATVEQHTLVSPPALDDLRTDSEATNTDRKEEKIAASNHNEGAESTCTDKLNNSDPKSVEKDMEDNDCTTAKPSEKLKRSTPDEAMESTNGNGNNNISSVSGCEVPKEPTTANEHKNGSVETKKNGSVAYSMQTKNQKYIRMWQLMYKHAVKGNTANAENQLPLDGEDKEEQVEGTNTTRETINLGFSETEEHTASINHTAGDPKIEFCHHDAIRLVQEAFDNILLPEVQDSSYDDQSITSGISSDQEALEQNRDECGEQSSSTSSGSAGDNILQNPEETCAEAENTSVPKEEKTVSKVGDKSDQKTPKSWSSLKKFILLKRFVKAIEKVRNLNYRKPRHLPLDPDTEAEKINLRQQKIEERKNAEEWMLDYALQQVISKLPPAQQRRVGLLVEAFETVLPFPELKTSKRSNAIDFTGADLPDCNGLSVQSSDQTGKGNDSGTSAGMLLGNMSCPEKSFNEHPDQVSDVQLEKQQSPVKVQKLKESSTEYCCIETELDITVSEATNEDQQENQIVSVNTSDGDDKVIAAYDKTDFTNLSLSEIKDRRLCDESSLKEDEHGSTNNEGLVNETVQEVPKEMISITSLEELSNINSKVKNINLEANKLSTETAEQSDSSTDQIPVKHVDSTADNMVISLASTEATEESMEAREEVNGGAMLESGLFQGLHPLEESRSGCNTDVPHETQLEKQKYSSLWFLVYKHMASSIAAEDGDKPLDRADEEEVEDTNTLPGTDIHGSCQSSSGVDQELGMKIHNADSKNIELRRIEAIKLVEKAIDEILLPENQDESDDGQSNTRDLIPDQEPPENKVGLDGKSSISTPTNPSTDCLREPRKNEPEGSPEELLVTSDDANIQEEEKTVPKVEDKPKQKISKNWSNLKKMILLNRFIKALEKVKTFNPKGPRYLPLEPDPEAEKVDLKHQNMDEKKNAEEWMLDYAVQQAVARLTPARKRKVALLVEAFETVIPNNGTPNPFKPQVTH